MNPLTMLLALRVNPARQERCSLDQLDGRLRKLLQLLSSQFRTPQMFSGKLACPQVHPVALLRAHHARRSPLPPLANCPPAFQVRFVVASRTCTAVQCCAGG